MLRQLWRVRQSLDVELCKDHAFVFVILQAYYCNSLLDGSPIPPPKWPILCWEGYYTLLTHSLKGLQTIWLTGNNRSWTQKHDSFLVLAGLIRVCHLHNDLHWLDVPYLIINNLNVTVHHRLQNKATGQLLSLVSCWTPVFEVASRLQLCSASRLHLTMLHYWLCTCGRSHE